MTSESGKRAKERDMYWLGLVMLYIQNSADATCTCKRSDNRCVQIDPSYVQNSNQPRVETLSSAFGPAVQILGAKSCGLNNESSSSICVFTIAQMRARTVGRAGSANGIG